MTKFLLAGAVLLASTAIPQRAIAQHIVSSLDLQGTRLQYADSVNATASGLSPAVTIEWSHATLGASGTYAQLTRAWSANGSLDGSLFSPSVGPLSAELATSLGGSTHQDGTRTGAALGMLRLRAAGERTGVWLGAGGGTTWDGIMWRALRRGEAGAWLDTGPATVDLTVQPNVVNDSLRYTDLSAQLRWRAGAFDVGAVAGTRAGSRLPAITSSTTTWANINVAAWVLPHVALIASAGNYPVDYTQGYPGGRFASLGIRLALSHGASATLAGDPADGFTAASSVVSDFQIVTTPGTMRTLRLRAPRAQIVEISGDFTDWQPRRLTQTPDGWSTITLPIASGTYQMNVRLDGGPWLVPRPLPAVQDEFGGATGVLVVP